MKTEKKKVSWSVTEAGLLACKYADKSTVSFDLVKLSKDFTTLAENVKFCLAYGVRQILSDSTARSKELKLTNKEKTDVMTKKFGDILAGKLKSDKLKGGGVSESSLLDACDTEEEKAIMAKMVAKAKAKKLAEKQAKEVKAEVEETEEEEEEE